MSRVIDPDKSFEDYDDDELAYALQRDMFEEEDAVRVSEYLRDKEAEGEDLNKMTVPELKEHAEANSIDLGDATKKADIIKAIKKATAAE